MFSRRRNVESSSRDPQGRARIPECRRAHLHRARPGDQKLRRVFAGRDPAQPDHRNLHRARRLVHQAQRHRLDGRTGKSAEAGADPRPPRAGVDRQADERVHQGKGVRAALLRRARQRFDGAHVGRKLDDHRPRGHALRRRHHFAQQRGVAREVDAAVARVGAGDVQFVPGQPLVIVEHAHHFHVVFHLVAEHVGEDRRAQAGQRRQFVPDEGAHADILQADRVDHAAFALIHARRRIAFDGLARQALHHEAAQRVEIHQLFEFHSVSEGAAGRQHRVAQCDAAKRRPQVRRHSPKASPSTRPSEEEVGATPMARARVGATSTLCTGDSKTPAGNCGP